MGDRMRWLTGTTFLLLLGMALPGNAAGQTQGPNSAGPVDRNEYVGWQTCVTCHPDQVAVWRETMMGKVMTGNPRNELEARACESCHGPGGDHAATADKTKIFSFAKGSLASPSEKNQQCLQCHEKGGRAHWAGSTHESRNLACVQCHTVMKNVSAEKQLAKPTVTEVCTQCHVQRKAESLFSSHMPAREGKLDCTDCHNPHGTTGPKLLVANSTNEVCYKCHAERRGPFLWEHPPVTENCLNCHEPHGAINDHLLKFRPPRLCQQCHIEQRHPTTPQVPTGRFAFNRSCLNCHSQIHGSNHPSGMRFHRD